MTTGLSNCTDTATALALRGSNFLRSPSQAANQENNQSVDNQHNKENRLPRQYVSQSDEMLALQNRRPFFPQATLNFKAQQALSQYQSTDDAVKKDELSQMLGVSIYV